MKLPRIVEIARAGEPLTDLQATAGKLWLGFDGGALDTDSAVRKAVDAHWQTQEGGDPYWDFLGNRGKCDRCDESYKYENLSICPNCFKTSCYRHDKTCTCGHTFLG